MTTPFDEMTEMLDGAPLTPEQRQAWHDLCSEVLGARARIQELENRVRILSKQRQDEGPTQTVLAKPDFNREVARMLAIDERYGTISSVLYFDIENLKDIKQRHGDELVDAAVRCICDALLMSVRQTDILGRLAPDEFGVLLPRCDNDAAWKKGEQLASKIFKALSDSWGPNLKPAVSYGAYTFGKKEDVGVGLKKAAHSLTKLIKQ